MMSVYIVDDSQVIRDRLSRELKEKIKMVRIKTAEGLDDIGHHLIKFSPDVVIVDIHLKEGSGFDVLEFVHDAAMDPVTIVLTNHATQPYKDKALGLGADYFFDKSHEFNKALEVIEKYANKS